MLGLPVGAVVGKVAGVGTVEFEVSPGIQMLKGLPEQPLDVGDAALQLAAVDVVEFGLVEPFGLEVVDLEGEVRRDPMLHINDHYVESCRGMSLPTISVR